MDNIKLEEVAKLEVYRDGKLVAWSTPHNGNLVDLGILKAVQKPYVVKVYYNDGRPSEEIPQPVEQPVQPS